MYLPDLLYCQISYDAWYMYIVLQESPVEK